MLANESGLFISSATAPEDITFDPTNRQEAVHDIKVQGPSALAYAVRFRAAGSLRFVHLWEAASTPARTAIINWAARSLLSPFAASGIGWGSLLFRQ